jgi:undecaprenyl diphosphate synthase
VDNISKIVEAAISEKIDVLSLFAFSCENWNRPKKEVDFLLKLINKKMDKNIIGKFNENGIQFHWIGFRNKLSSKLITKLLWVEESTKNNKKIILNLCFNYGGKQDILYAINQLKKCPHKKFTDLLLTNKLPSVDLLIRTSGEKRISNFLLWQLEYAEIIFEPTLWPDYNKDILRKNILEFSLRQRRFGVV